MYHQLQFRLNFHMDLKVPGRARLELLRIRKGTFLTAMIRPYIAETPEGPVEMADLDLADGSAALGVPFEAFQFVDLKH
jgi:hypothetical protein